MDILRLDISLEDGDLDFDRIKPLLRAVLANEPDDKIWDQVYRAVPESPRPRPAVTGWYPWVITRETLAPQRYEKEHPDAQSASPQPK